MRKIYVLSIVAIFALILTFICSNADIIPCLKDTFLEQPLYDLSYPNPIISKLSIGYLTGLFLYIITTYIPEQKRIQLQNKMTVKHLNLIYGRIYSIIHKVERFIPEEKKIKSLSEEQLKEYFKNIELRTELKSLHFNKRGKLVPTELSKGLHLNWGFVIKELEYLDNFPFLPSTKVFNLIKSIKESKFQLFHSSLLIATNKNLTVWSSAFFELNVILQELEKVQAELNK